MQKLLLETYNLLSDHFGFRNWWPAETPFEVCVGAILTQNTSWKNVEKALYNLKQANKLNLTQILKTEDNDLAELIRPSGYYNLKTKRLKALCKYLSKHGTKDLTSFESLDTVTFRKQLLDVYGVGEETADSILLYAFERKVFVIDAYTKRISFRLGISKEDISYEKLQNLYVKHIPKDISLYNDFHAQYVALGSTFCKPKPLCKECPLNKICEFAR